MNKRKFCDAEEHRLHWLINFKLPNQWKKIGWGILFLSFGFLIISKFLDGDYTLVSSIFKKTALLGLLIVTISKEKIEDELAENLRSKAFSFAFIIGVVYVLVQPLINYLAFVIVKPQNANYEDLGDFQILWFLLVVYLMTFWFLKKRNS
ncbi:hypothetical protein Aeqsu_0025 [Aequorivita sublithincola DSM 14238]|uniref:Uncharacterized protein n=1 Tax=Aequorivita sublithincola (strain DSM 14238 / LMG 21431 / ACAM 643 / 9-3) TaxID=746697 RepID=I3YRD9_AEQSU|nr:hypothetical protein [Aequorivita sublithincola]AFL79557.1 hypothetical protein Aeqsu_0025 [Aequorivita sublithincola DSM 14238]